MRKIALAALTIVLAVSIAGCGAAAGTAAVGLPAPTNYLSAEQVLHLNPNDQLQLQEAWLKLGACSPDTTAKTLTGADWASLTPFQANQEAASCQFAKDILQMLSARASLSQSMHRQITRSFSERIWKDTSRPDSPFIDVTTKLELSECEEVTGHDYADCVTDGFNGVQVFQLRGPQIFPLPAVPDRPLDSHFNIIAPGKPVVSGMAAYAQVRDLAGKAMQRGKSFTTARQYMLENYMP